VGAVCHTFGINAKREQSARALLPERTLGARYGILAANDPDEYQDDRNQEQEVDESAERIGRDESQRPEDQQNDSYGEKHGMRIIGW